MNITKKEVSFRQAISNDTALVARLATYTFREAWTESDNDADIDQYVNEYFSHHRIAKELEDENIIYLLSIKDEEVTGYLKLERNLQPDGHYFKRPMCISRVYVKHAFQGMKIGSGLLAQATAIARNENFEMIWLGVWNENVSAIRLYERYGFKQFGTYKFIMGSVVSDDYLMMKYLS